MVAATISRVQDAIWHTWAAHGRAAAGGADLRQALRFATSTASRCHQQREPLAAAPQAHQLASRTDDLMASTI